MLFEGDNDRIQSGSSTVGSAAFLAPELCGGLSGGPKSASDRSSLASFSFSSQTPPSTGTSSPVLLSPQPSPPCGPTPSLLRAIAAHQQLQQATRADAAAQGLTHDNRSFSLPITIPPPATLSDPHHIAYVSSADSQSESHEISGRKGDIWSFGVTLYVMVFGRLPFMAKTVPLIYRAIVEEALTFPPVDDAQLNPNGVAAETHADLIDLLHSMMDKNPHTRISLSEIKRHPWVTRNGTEPLEDDSEYFMQSRRPSSVSRRQSLAAQRRATRTARAEAAASDMSSGGGGGGEIVGTELEAPAEAEESDLTETDEDVDEDAPTRQSSTVYQPISLTSQDMADAVTLVSRVIMVVKLKSKMRRHRLQLAARARSFSVDDGQPMHAVPLRARIQNTPTVHTNSNITMGTSSSANATPQLDTGTNLSPPPPVSCLSPSLSATSHIRVPVDMAHSHSHASSSKRRALVGSTQALLQAARGAIRTGTPGEMAAQQWGETHVAASSSPRMQHGTSILKTSPMSPISNYRMPQFPHRKSSQADIASSPESPPPPESLSSAGRHQSAPLRPSPFFYVPFDTFVQQPHSLSCNNLEDESEEARLAALASTYPNQPIDHSHLISDNSDSDADVGEEDTEATTVTAVDQDLDI